MGRPVITRTITLLVAIAAAGALAWWGFLWSARVPPLPPVPPDEGQENQLQQAYLEALLRHRPERWQARVNLAALYAQQGRDAEALDLLRTALRQNPGDLSLVRAFAYSAERARSSDDELRAWSAIARGNPRDLEAHIHLATLYYRLKWTGMANRAAVQALRL